MVKATEVGCFVDGVKEMFSTEVVSYLSARGFGDFPVLAGTAAKLEDLWRHRASATNLT